MKHKISAEGLRDLKKHLGKSHSEMTEEEIQRALEVLLRTSRVQSYCLERE